MIAALQGFDADEEIQLLPVDAPWFDYDAIRVLMGKMYLNPNLIGVMPVDNHGSHPLMARFKCGPVLEFLLSQPPKSLQSLFDEIGFEQVTKDEFIDAGCHAKCLFNINNPDDLNG